MISELRKNNYSFLGKITLETVEELEKGVVLSGEEPKETGGTATHRKL